VRVPLVVLTGFLGAGKTTLVNRLITRRAAAGEGSAKLGVIVNELGQVGIDAALIGGDAAKQVELPGGCVCCVLGDELDRTLLELVAANPTLEAILLETTGAAEPIPIVWATEREPVAAKIRAAAVVTVVDAVNHAASRRISPAVDAQLAYADVVLVTKAEQATPEALAEAHAAIAELAPRALVRVGSAEAHAAWLDEVLRDPLIRQPEAGPAVEPKRHHDDPEHVHTDACRHPDSHAHGIDSVWTPVDATYDLEDLEDALGALPANYVRIKGIVRAVDHRDSADASPRLFAIHRVGLRVSSEPFDGADHEAGRVVALGPGVRRDELAACLTA